jgi:hypothetical protein
MFEAIFNAIDMITRYVGIFGRAPRQSSSAINLSTFSNFTNFIGAAT